MFFQKPEEPEYAKEYSMLKKKRNRAKWIGRLISFAFIPLFWRSMSILSENEDSQKGLAMLGLTVLFYGFYWSAGTVFRAFKRIKQERELRTAFLKKAAFEEGVLGCEQFWFDAEAGLSDDMLYGSGLLLPGGQAGPNNASDNQPGVREDVNCEYMSGVCRGVSFERATVDLTPGPRRFNVNWMVFRLPYNTKTSMRYLSGMFAGINRSAGILGEAFYRDESTGGGLYHIAGEKPSEELKDAVLRLAGAIGDECEILVLGDRLHVLLKRDGYQADLPGRKNFLTEEEIRKQIAGRISELNQCAMSLNETVFAKEKAPAEKAGAEGSLQSVLF